MSKFRAEKVKSHFWFCGYGRRRGELSIHITFIDFKKKLFYNNIENENRNGIADTFEELIKWLFLLEVNNMFEYSKNLMDKIRNKKELTSNELMTIERSLRLYEINEDMINYQIGLDKDNKYELTEYIK